MPDLIAPGRLASRAADLLDNGWALAGDNRALTKTYNFKDFATAMTFINRVAFEAEKAEHHPEWRNVYGRVEVRLTTHDSGGISTMDLWMARRMESIAWASQAM